MTKTQTSGIFILIIFFLVLLLRCNSKKAYALKTLNPKLVYRFDVLLSVYVKILGYFLGIAQREGS